MKLFLLILSLIDIFSGLSFYFSLNIGILYLILLSKGIWTMFSSFYSKDLFGIFLGIIDSLVGIFGIFSFFEFKILGILVLLKGFYSVIFSF